MDAPFTPITIVGAGPTGLSLAVELRRRGVECRILEKNLRRAAESRALALHARTLETFEGFGVAEEAVRRGRKITRLNAYWEGEPAFSLRISLADTVYGFVLSLPQSETERLLEERLETAGGRVERGTELVAVRQDAAGVDAFCLARDGTVERLRSRWLVGCDGAHSNVRELLGLSFEGATYEERFVLADVGLDWAHAEGEAHVFFSAEGSLAVLPLPEEHRFRLICQVAEGEGAGRDLFAERLLAARAGTARIRDVEWLSAFRIHRRLVARYRDGRVFLAGDAAHLHSPVGGQGLNTGIQDAENLGWKLAWVEKGEGPEALLESYDEERRPVAASVVKQTHRATRLVTPRSRTFQRLRNRLAAIALRIPAFDHRVLRGLAELDITYRSRIVAEHWPQGFAKEGPRAGQRAPDAGSGETRLYDRLDPLRPTLLLLRGPGEEGRAARLAEVAEAVRSRYGGRIASLLVAASPAPEGWGGSHFPDPDGTVREAYGGTADCAYLVRPDRYVGFRALPADAGSLLAYLERILS